MTVRILHGHVLDRLRELDDESVHCVVTSPPYWGLRDYGVAEQLGLEATPQAYLENMVGVFREIRRVLRSDGTAWVNMGDSYAGARRGGNTATTSTLDGARANQEQSRVARQTMCDSRRRDDTPIPRSDVQIDGLKSKDMVGMPWRLAFALQADGWWLRQDIIWHKKNPMPESVRDRCTKAHEYLFLLAKSERYYFDDTAIREPLSENTNPRAAREKPVGGWDTGPGSHATLDFAMPKNGGGRKFGPEGVKTNASFAAAMREPGRKRSGNKERKPASARGVPVDTNGQSNGAVAGSVPWEGYERSKRSVWSIATEPFPEAHFATFPTKLVEPCILAGCPEGGTVLDPFGGAGTTGLVARSLNRNAILIELNAEYVAMADRRINGPLFAATGT